jgi:hypothetical protein
MGLTRIYNKTNNTSETEVINTDIKLKKCYFCEGNHVCRECPQEALLAPVLKKYIGKIMEDFIGNNFCCPRCNTNKLAVLGNHSPSLDIICGECERKYEVKSKCLSINNLPNDLKLPHGNFEEYKNRQDNGLDLFVIIYKVDRINKKITIREVLYADNKEILKNDNIQVLKRNNSHLSTITINNKKLLNKLKLNRLFQFDFSSIIENYLKSNNFINKIKSFANIDNNNYII